MSTDSEKDLAEDIRTLRIEAANPWWRPEVRDRLIERALRLEERLLRLQAARRVRGSSAGKPGWRPRGRELRQATAKALKPPDKLN
jgi:hypothetical protein